ncbi:MAG TPA: tetratricopeptide repeat protein, partial [Terracidiphilus sp.]|nr:tetratricopeptide repeat protein [Terracidiphilus sp.]
MQTADQLIANQQWRQVVRLLAPAHARTAQMNYDYGLALAHLGQWQEAGAALQAGGRLAPTDPRFPIELAGIAYSRKDYPRAARLLRQALKLAPGDAYANNFLATIYFLQGNTAAALKYWNRVNKPFIAAVRAEPTPRVSPALLDHAFAFSPAATMSLAQYQDSEERIGGLGIFP